MPSAHSPSASLFPSPVNRVISAALVPVLRQHISLTITMALMAVILHIVMEIHIIFTLLAEFFYVEYMLTVSDF